MGDLTNAGYGPLSPDLDFDRFVALCSDPTGGVATPLATEVVRGIPIYDGAEVRRAISNPTLASAFRTEVATVVGSGAGVFVVCDAWNDLDVLDAMTAVLHTILEDERSSKADAFDHFASQGANSRAWDVLGKSAKLDPEAYVSYYANPILTLAAEAWLGPFFQVTAQVNIVHPGGAAQSPHRDYHLGFLTDADAARFPAHVHRLSQALTLQGAVAHSAMPIKAGPTMLLPGSQRFEAGYLAWRDERFAEFFAEHQVQLALDPGDAVFFNPGLHHAAGENNTTEHDRIGNLLQISSAFGIAMESVDRPGIAAATFPVLRKLAANDELTDDHIAVCAAGYAFPTNLDTDASTAGLAPPTMQDIMRDALTAGWSASEFAESMAELVDRQRPA